MPNRWAWRRADVALAWLILLATLASWLALTLSATGSESILALVVTVCRRSVLETISHAGELGRLSLLLPLGIGLVLANIEALRLLLATRRWIASLAPDRCTPTRRLKRVAQKCGLLQGTVLVQSNRPFVFTYGFLNPRVWLSTGLINALASDELEAVLRHEAHHRQARDPLKIMVARCLSRALFFIPVAHDLCDTYYLTKELAADEYAVRAMSDALPLARALRKLIAAQFQASPELALVSELGATETRLKTLLSRADQRPYFELKHLGLSLFWLLVLAGILYAPAAGHLPSFAECSVPAVLKIGLRLATG